MTRYELIRALRNRWTRRPRVNMSLPLMPTWLLVSTGGFSAIYTVYLAWVLSSVVPAYFDAATQTPFDRTALVLTIQILLIATAAWCFGEIMSVCRGELESRLFG